MANGGPLAVYVKDGKIVRMTPISFDARDPQPWTIEARGKKFTPPRKTSLSPHGMNWKSMVYAPNRLLTPLKRVDFDPNGERNVQNRGISGYEPISWDEAFDLVASEIKRMKRDYGQGAIAQSNGSHHNWGNIGYYLSAKIRFMNAIGTTTVHHNPDSWEGWYWGAKHVWGMEPVGEMWPVTNVIPDILKNGDMDLFWGCDPETTPWGWNGQIVSRLCYWFTELGIKQVYVCPDVNYGTAVHADKWIPIRPNTDAALQLAIAYTWITEGTYDREYIASHAVGFDKFEAYVLGKEDGITKTPKWAETKTGIPSRIIKRLAREWASKRTAIAHTNGGPYIRGPYSTEPARLEVILLGMQGLGKPGCHQLSVQEWGLFGESGTWRTGDNTSPLPVPTVWPDVMAVTGAFPPWMQRGSDPVIPKTLVPDAILNPPLIWYGTTLCREPIENQFAKYTYPAEGCSEIHMIWTDSPCRTTCWNAGNKTVEAFRSLKIECVVAQHPWLENDCLIADIILPSNTTLEVEDIVTNVRQGVNFHSMAIMEQAVKPIGESKSDYEVVIEIAKKLGLEKEYTGDKSIEEWIKHGFNESGVPEAGLCTWEELCEKDYYVIPTDPDWKKYPAGMIEFYEDPKKHPMTTPTGLIEFYSKGLAEHFPDDDERPPVPHWIEKGESHDEALSSARTRLYPLLIMSNHGRWRVHAQCDDISWTREAPTCKVDGPDGYKYEPLWINPAEAGARGIKNGDVVKVYNERGTVLGGAYVTERIMPGVVYMDHGARYDPIVPGELDRGGAINTITPHNITSKNATGMVVSGFLVEVMGVNLGELRTKYPEAFARPYHPDSGLRLERVLAGK